MYQFIRLRTRHKVLFLFQSRGLYKPFEVKLAGTDSINHLKPTGDPARNGSPARSANGSEEEDVNENGKITGSPNRNEECLTHKSCLLNILIRFILLNQGRTTTLCMQFSFWYIVSNSHLLFYLSHMEKCVVTPHGIVYKY